MGSEALKVEVDGRGVATVALDRPEVRNAFDAELIGRLTEAFTELGRDDGVRVVVLTGGGDIFCAGADLNWLAGMVDYSYEENTADSHRFERMLRAVNDCPKPVVARVNGHALGGGTGLIACVDIAVAQRGGKYGFTEVRLGIAPAVISPYVLPKIGMTHARHLFLTAEVFGAEEAQRIGLVHRVVAPDELDAAVDEVVGDLLAGGPLGQTHVKRLLRELPKTRGLDEAADLTVDTIATLRVSDEGQDGMRAFLEKREPAWRSS